VKWKAETYANETNKILKINENRNPALLDLTIFIIQKTILLH